MSNARQVGSGLGLAGVARVRFLYSFRHLAQCRISIFGQLECKLLNSKEFTGFPAEARGASMAHITSLHGTVRHIGQSQCHTVMRMRSPSACRNRSHLHRWPLGPVVRSGVGLLKNVEIHFVEAGSRLFKLILVPSRQNSGRLNTCNYCQKCREMLAQSRKKQRVFSYIPLPIFAALSEPPFPKGSVLANELPKHLFVMSQQFRIAERQFCEPIRRVNIPEVPRLSPHRLQPIRPFSQRHSTKCVLNRPLNKTRQRAPLFACSQFRKVTQLRVKTNCRDFRSRQLATTLGFCRFLRHAADFMTS